MCIAATGQTTTCSTSEISRQLFNLQLDDNDDDIICYNKDPTQHNWKIVLPESMVVDTVKWFHQVMGHPGEKRLQETLNQRYYHPRRRYHIEKLKC